MFLIAVGYVSTFHAVIL